MRTAKPIDAPIADLVARRGVEQDSPFTILLVEMASELSRLFEEDRIGI